MHDSDYCSRKASEARMAARKRGNREDAEIAGHLALAYACLAKRRQATASEPEAEKTLITEE